MVPLQFHRHAGPSLDQDGAGGTHGRPHQVRETGPMVRVTDHVGQCGVQGQEDRDVLFQGVKHEPSMGLNPRRKRRGGPRPVRVVTRNVPRDTVVQGGLEIAVGVHAHPRRHDDFP